jgi:hypothetical protein
MPSLTKSLNKADLVINGVKYAVRYIPESQQWGVWRSLGGRHRLPDLWDSMGDAVLEVLDDSYRRKDKVRLPLK